MIDALTWRLTSRRRVVLVTLGILLVLDLGRSIYARLGYAQPAEPWQNAPYEGLPWPPGTDLSPNASLGERVYVKHCALCHGRTGQGNGPAAPSQIPRPRDFTLGEYKYKSTPADQSPSDSDLIEIVAHGLNASAMPYWEDILSNAEIHAVVQYIKDFSPFPDGGPRPAEIALAPRIPPDANSVARGKVLYENSCTECHGMDGRGSTTPQDETDEYPVPIRDLTAPWTFRGGSAPEQLWLRLTTGLKPGPMPEYADALTPEERWDLVNYVLSLARPAPWEPGGVLDGPGHHADLTKRGEYLVHAEMCGLCHTQVNTDMIYSGDNYYLAGGMGIPIYPHAVFVSRNLTSDPDTGLGNWTREEIATAIRDGRSPERGLNLWAMPWLFLHSFTQEDALAIAAYLESLPPVTNEIPPPLHYGIVETVIAKIIHSSGIPPIGNPKALTYKTGNYGQTEPGWLPPDWPQQLLVGAQWLVLLGGVFAFVLAGPVERRFPRGISGWVRFSFALTGISILAILSWVMYRTPVLGFVPPGEVNRAVTSSIYKPDPDSFDNPQQAALAERGRYLFTVTSCAFCHGNDGSGGAKVSMRSFGTLWVRNISSDLETGIGAWSDAEIARAIRSGVSRDGSALHWQGMVWDHLSNLDEEDIRALLVYLRTLPPVRKAIPSPQPPSADDCLEYTFYLFETEKPGCE